MRYFAVIFFSAAVVCWAAPAFAQICRDHSPEDFAVMFKLKEVFGDGFPFGLDSMSLRELGDRHWKARKLKEWAFSQRFYCIGSQYRDWLRFYLKNIDEEVSERSVKHQPTPDPYNEIEQEEGHKLAARLPTPGSP